MNAYEVTFANGEVVIVAAWTPEMALAIAEQQADRFGCGGLSLISAVLAGSPETEPTPLDSYY